MINKVILIGNLGKDPEIRTLESGASYAKMSVATNESYKDKNGEWQNITEWHNIIMWRALAERAEKQLKKGSLVYIEGKLTSRSYQDQDGNTKYITEVRANSYRLLEKREYNGDSSEPTDKYATVDTASSTQKETSPAQKETSSTAGDSDDLPF